ncbi:hypothetical protein [Planktothricoides raciborskii]|uniref:Uncharacterized protein n=1 Tax=Planktothricoides raciborskii FACHB-1370 TaxID=2949576 RepID=A0ABR8EEG1_9CYAN|nr:hypothetical protein [Planktothricoides raciborskii]MBD2544514.1 hypothetical protein [Planktothricoides raciborskii FACHB-1370]MBD2585231.1 hypothetical protein [Planktothricoides raciborskii FACHB-1261]
MVKYSFTLEIKGSQDKYGYTVDLNQSGENRPEGFFTQDVCQTMRMELQRQSLCRIDNNALNRIVKTWIQDIKEGYRSSSLTLELLPLSESNIEELSDCGNQEIPPIIYPDISQIEPVGGALPLLNFC